jgi:hypothetical protein
MSSVITDCSRFSPWLSDALQQENPLPLSLDTACQCRCLHCRRWFHRLVERHPKSRKPVRIPRWSLSRPLCGSGASGRNGGFVLSLWAKYQSLAKMCGEAEALRLCQQSSQAIVELEPFASSMTLMPSCGWTAGCGQQPPLPSWHLGQYGQPERWASIPTNGWHRGGRLSGSACIWTAYSSRYRPPFSRHAGAWSVAPRPAAGVKVYESSPWNGWKAVLRHGYSARMAAYAPTR